MRAWEGVGRKPFLGGVLLFGVLLKPTVGQGLLGSLIEKEPHRGCDLFIKIRLNIQRMTVIGDVDAVKLKVKVKELCRMKNSLLQYVQQVLHPSISKLKSFCSRPIIPSKSNWRHPSPPSFTNTVQ